MQVEPQNTIPLLYQITDPSDSTVYYIRAVVYDSLTRNVLSTNNLVSRGGGLWSSTAIAPVDSSGLGRHIHVIIRVYTDSGYTTLSSLYNQQIDKYLVKSSVRLGAGGGGSGQDIDYDKIRKIVVAVLTEKEKEKEPPEPVDLSEIDTKLSPLFKAIDAIKSKLNEPEKPLNVSPIIEKVENIKKEIIAAIDAIEKPKEPKDYTLSLRELGNRIDIAVNEVKTLTDSVSLTNDSINSSVKSIKETLATSIGDESKSGNKIRIELAGAGPSNNGNFNKYLN